MLLRRLCVFAGRFTLDDVEAVCGSDDLPPGRALDLLSSLRGQVAGGQGGRRWHRLLPAARDDAGVRALELREAGEETAARAALRRTTTGTRCRQFAAEGRHRLLEWLPWMELEIDNIRAVLRRSLDQDELRAGIDLAISLMLVLDYPGDHGGRAVARRAARRGRRNPASTPGRTSSAGSWPSCRAIRRLPCRRWSGVARSPRDGTTRGPVPVAVDGVDRGRAWPVTADLPGALLMRRGWSPTIWVTSARR